MNNYESIRPLEKVLIQLPAFSVTRKKEGHIIVTSTRVLFREGLTFTIQKVRAGTKMSCMRRSRKNKQGVIEYWVVQIVEQNDSSTQFRFFGPNGEADSQQLVTVISQQPDDQVRFLSEEALEKIINLQTSDELMQVFNDKINIDEEEEQRAINEADFWYTNKDQVQCDKSDVSMEDVNETQKQVSADQNRIQVRGVQNRPITLTRKQNNATQKIDYFLTQDDCERLLAEYPRLLKAYEENSQIDKDQVSVANEKFWREFLQKNLQYKTEPFGGINPIFVPYTDQTQQYEDLYIDNQDQILTRQNHRTFQTGAENNHLGMEVDFDKNLETDIVPEGFGSYKSGTEGVDALAARGQDLDALIDADLMKIKKKEEKQEIKAQSVIANLNNNSERVLGICEKIGQVEKVSLTDDRLANEKQQTCKVEQKRSRLKPKLKPTSATVGQNSYDQSMLWQSALNCLVQYNSNPASASSCSLESTCQEFQYFKNEINEDHKSVQLCTLFASNPEALFLKESHLHQQQISKYKQDFKMLQLRLRQYYKALHSFKEPSDYQKLDQMHQVQTQFELVQALKKEASDEIKKIISLIRQLKETNRQDSKNLANIYTNAIQFQRQRVIDTNKIFYEKVKLIDQKFKLEHQQT